MGLVTKFVRYAGVSAISTVVSLVILGALVASGATSAAWANVVATVVGTVPSFELNRRWVWNRTGPRSLLREIGPFGALSMLSLALSTVAVAATAGWVDGWHADATVRTVVAETAHVGTFGLLWIVQYVLLDRILFRPAHDDRHLIDEAGADDRHLIDEAGADDRRVIYEAGADDRHLIYEAGADGRLDGTPVGGVRIADAARADCVKIDVHA
jgi:putative flippase GtrA